MNENGYDPRGQFPEMPEVKRRYTPEEAGHDTRRKPVSRIRRRRRKSLNPGVLLICLILAAVIGVSLYLIISGKNRTALPQETSGVSAGETTEPLESVDDGRDWYTVTVSEAQIYVGDLILVNASTEYRFPAEAENSITAVSSLKNGYYLLADPDAKLEPKVIESFNKLCSDYYAYSGFAYMQVNSAYRSRDDQISIYNQYTESYGADYAKAYVANPGFSEHHTGLAMDLNINRNGAISYVESDEGAAWFRENAGNYGFILRYPSDKVYMTGINYETWHYRYVGTPHSLIMNDMNMCLEEYERFLKDYTYDTTRIAYNNATGVEYVPAEEDADGRTLIYYAPSEGEETEIKIPKGYTYELSGNNTDGFIITANPDA